MSLLDDTDLAYLRDAQGQGFPSLASFDRAGSTADGEGGTTAGYTEYATNIPARVSTVVRKGGNNEAIVGDREFFAVGYLITIPWNSVAVKNTDRIRVQGRTFEVASVSTNDWQTATRIKATEVLGA